MDITFADLMSHGKKIVILTAGREKGKTTTCQKWISQAKKLEWNIRGVICPGIFVNGEKIAIDILDLSTGESRRLAKLIDETGGEVITDRWKFDPLVLNWGSQVLQRIQTCDLLVVDELGPLEFKRKQGWVEAFDVIGAGKYRLAIVVIRPELLEEACQLWPDCQVLKLEDE